MFTNPELENLNILLNTGKFNNNPDEAVVLLNLSK